MRVGHKGRPLAVVGWILFVASCVLTLLFSNIHYMSSAGRNVIDTACMLITLTSIILLFVYYTVHKIEKLHIWTFVLFAAWTVMWYIVNVFMQRVVYIDQILGRQMYSIPLSIIDVVILSILFILYSFVYPRRINRACVIAWLVVRMASSICSLSYFMQLNYGYTYVLLLIPIILYATLIILIALRKRCTAVISGCIIVLNVIYQIWYIGRLLQLASVFEYLMLWMRVYGCAYFLEIILDLSVFIAIWFREGGCLLFKRKIPYEQIEAELLDLKTRFDKGEISARKYSRLKEKVLRKIDLR